MDRKLSSPVERKSHWQMLSHGRPCLHQEGWKMCVLCMTFNHDPSNSGYLPGHEWFRYSHQNEKHNTSNLTTSMKFLHVVQEEHFEYQLFFLGCSLHCLTCTKARVVTDTPRSNLYRNHTPLGGRAYDIIRWFSELCKSAPPKGHAEQSIDRIEEPAATIFYWE